MATRQYPQIRHVSLTIFLFLSFYIVAESRYIVLSPLDGQADPIIVKEVAILAPATSYTDLEDQDSGEEETIQKRSPSWEVRKKNYLDLSEVSAVLNEMIGRKGSGGGGGNSIKMKPVRFSLGGR